MLEDMRKYVRAGLEALSSQGAEDAAGVIMSRAGALAEQLTSFASGFLEWSAEARASLLQEVRDMITRQVESMGLASKDDVETLRRRVDRLEARPTRANVAAATSGRRAATKATSRTGSSARKAASARKASTRKAASARKASTRKAASARKASTRKAASARKATSTRSSGSRRSTSE
jgi:hypothetical protein